MRLADYLSQARGRTVKLAREIGAPVPNVSEWGAGKRPIPTAYGWAIENATAGQVSRRDLFPPDVLAAHWPELMQQPIDGEVDHV